ncbi:MAG: SRPBCC family protein [Flavobacteriales bacterium]|nr:SRPBCC family protein [Flavobacteriales bacterium]
MKLLKFFIIFVIFAFVGTAIAMLFVKTSHKSQSSFSVKMSANQCLDMCLNPEYFTQWMDQLEKTEAIGSDYNQPAFEANLYFLDGRIRSRAIYTVDSVISEKKAITQTNLANKIVMETIFNLEQHDSITTVNAETKLTPKGWYYKLMLNGASQAIDEKRKAEMKRLEELLKSKK